MKKLLIACCAVMLGIPNTQAQEIALKGKQLFGDITARHIGPALMSGRIIDLEGHPTNNKIIYAGTAGGGVWKSENGGASFSPIFDEYAQSIGVVAVDPTNPDKEVWVGTGEIWTRNSVSVGDGLYKSNDGGKNWKKIEGFENSERIAAIEINPNNNQEVYVAVLGALWSDSEDRGLYKTTDGGKTWEKIFYVDQRTGASDLIMDPNDPNTLYLAMWEFRRTGWGFNSGGPGSALYKSTDGGKNWDKIHNGFPAGELGRFAIAVAPSDSNRLYAVVESKENKGLYGSTDAGASWKLLNTDFGLVVRPFYFSRIVVDPKNPDIIVKGGLFGSMSRDGGNTFKQLGAMHADIHDILFDINDSTRMYSGTDGGVYRSWDSGVTFDMVDNLPLSQFYQISVDNETPYNVYGGLQDNGSWWGPSSSPGGIEARDWKRVGQGDGFRVLRHPTKAIIYSEMQGAQNVWRYDIEKDKTKNVAPVPEGDDELRFNWNAPMAVSAHAPDRFYMGSQYVHRSDDMGDNWVKISPDLTTNDPAKQDKESGGISIDKSGAETHTTIFTIAESPLDENVLWVGTDDGNVQVTRDGGKTWDNVTANLVGIPANTWVYHIEASVHGAGTAYAVFDGHSTGDMKPYALKTTDYGKTWKNIISDDVIGFARNLQEDYESENLLYLGTEFGLFISIDGGANWSRFTNNMPATAVHFIDLQKQTNDLVLGTHGRGVIIIDDISPLRQINQEVLAKDLHFLDTKASVMKETGGFGGGSTELQFVGGNPSSAAKIMYYLKKRHTFGKMTLEIQDMEGNTLTSLIPGKAKGINIVRWNHTATPPKTASGKNMVFGAFTAPRVPAGQYKVVITKKNEVFEHIINVKYDENSILTQADRDKHGKQVDDLFGAMESLAYVVYQLDEWKKVAEGVIKDHPKGAKVAQKAWDKLDALRTTLVVTTGDNYVNEAEPLLRENLAELYGTVAGGFEPASAAQEKNIAKYQAEVAQAEADLAAIMKKEVAKLQSFISKNDIETPEMPSMEEFVQK